MGSQDEKVKFAIYIDFSLLRKQKEHLLNVESNPLIDGVICLLDAIQDQACDSKQRSQAQVFGKSLDTGVNHRRSAAVKVQA